MRTSTVLGPVLLVAALALGGCGSSDPAASDTASASASASAPAGPHNAADVTFAQQMVPHHTQALAMVDLAEGHDLDPDVQSIVDGIKSSQSKEVATMTGWLEGWGETVPTTAGESMDGMLSSDDLTRLKDTDDDIAFQRLWLFDMIQHHRGAIPMAQTEIKNGANPSAIALAKDIVRVQEQELGTMGGMLGQ